EEKEDINSEVETLSIMRGYEKKESLKKEEIPIFEDELNQKFGMDIDNLEELVEAEVVCEVETQVHKEEECKKPFDQEITVQKEVVTDKSAEASTPEENKAVSAEIGQAMEKKKKDYIFPKLELLNSPKKDGKSTSDVELRDTAIKLKTTLESFGVKVEMKNVSCGPAVTRYELQPAQGVKVSKITSLTDDIKLSLAAADIRIEAPIPGKSAVGIEVPNKQVSMVYLKSLLESKEFKNHKSNIAFAVGKDIGGKTVVTDIAKMPHLLIAGATGSGKSVCINTLIMSILYKANPDDVKLIMVDPKVVELSVYNGIPHLLIPVVTDPKKASGALNWAVMEMTERYKKFADLGVRDIKGYNEKVKPVEDDMDERFQKMPQIIIIVDELADLMMVAPGEVEDAICRLAQLARAAGIHLIIATQRPSVNVITGLIKANIPSRVAFAVSSAIDSRTILDGGGAEKLLGNGDMLFFPSGYPKPIRVQGSYVSDKEVSSVVDFLKAEYGKTEYSEEIDQKITTSVTSDSSLAGGENKRDDYFAEAGRFVIEKDKASIGMLQRVYKIGFNRAARIMDQLYDAGVVGPEEGTKPRKVVMSVEEFEQFIEEYV
ncbi:MAG: DNA translocase FtsK, partial [Velocimicrobium sp.]